MFNELKAANDRNDLKRVAEILDKLEQGNTFVPRSETVTEKALVKHERVRLQTLVDQLRTEVQALQQSDTYQTINQITDWDNYFAEKRQQLEEQLEALAV